MSLGSSRHLPLVFLCSPPVQQLVTSRRSRGGGKPLSLAHRGQQQIYEAKNATPCCLNPPTSPLPSNGLRSTTLPHLRFLFCKREGREAPFSLGKVSTVACGVGNALNAGPGETLKHLQIPEAPLPEQPTVQRGAGAAQHPQKRHLTVSFHCTPRP